MNDIIIESSGNIIYEPIEKSFTNFLQQNKVDNVLLLKENGHLLVDVGDFYDQDLQIIGSLISGSFCATSALGALLGESACPVINFEGSKKNILAMPVTGSFILCSFFDDKLYSGLIKLKMKELVGDIVQYIKTN